jgi:hypothetical protein
MSYLRYLCSLVSNTYCVVVFVLLDVILCFVYSMLLVSPNCPFFYCPHRHCTRIIKALAWQNHFTNLVLPCHFLLKCLYQTRHVCSHNIHLYLCAILFA